MGGMREERAGEQTEAMKRKMVRKCVLWREFCWERMRKGKSLDIAHIVSTFAMNSTRAR